jgi:hypothetical protein
LLIEDVSDIEDIDLFDTAWILVIEKEVLRVDSNYPHAAFK